MSSPPYVEYIRSIDEATNKVSNTVAPLEGMRVIQSPYHTPVPPSPLHHFLVALEHRS
jgi:hypothetical protein